MASTSFLIMAAVLIAGAHAKFVWEDDPADDDFPKFKIPMPVPPVPPTPPRLPFAPFQPFRPFQPFAQFRPFVPFPPFPPTFNFPKFPTIPPPVVLTPEQIKNAKPGPNQMFTGTVVKSESSMVMGKDGKYERRGGTAVLTNQDGVVREYKHGNAPPDINKPIQVGQPW